MSLVSPEQAIAHLRILATDLDNADLLDKLAAAEAIILDYINRTPHWRAITPTWTAETVPRQVHQAILLELGELWRGRGDDFDDEAPPRRGEEDLAPAIIGLLRRTSDPGMA